MVKAAIFSALLAVEATDLAVSYSDCGDDSYLVKINAVSPSVISMSGEQTITGSGTLSKTVTDAVSYTLAMETQFEDCTGPASTGGKCNFPLNMGSIEFKGIDIPAKAGEVPIAVDLELSRLLPASLMESTTLVTGIGKDSGNKIFCMNVYTKKSADSHIGVGILDVDWSDCGDADTKAIVHSLTPAQLKQGSIQNIVGTATLSEDVNEEIMWESSMRVKFVECAGDASVTKKCNFPLDEGSITFQGMETPVQEGDVDVSVVVSMSKLIPQSAAITTTHVTATSASGEKLFCLNVNTDKAAATAAIEDDLDCSAATCPKACTCSKDKCADQLSACLADAACASSQGCAFACSCGDTACMLKCAAASPSMKALPIATCVNSNCNEGNTMAAAIEV